MVLTTFNFSKDKNSTKIPDSGGTDHNVTLKENCSVIKPIFILRYDGTPTFNYCHYIFGYYFVDDIVMQNKNIYEVHCSLDVLGTYRSDILGSTQFIKRSTSDYNANLYDAIFDPQLNPIITQETTQSPLDSTGTYIAKISSSTSASFGVTYVCGSRAEISNLIGRCYDLNNWDNFLTTGLESLQKTVFDFSQYIQEIYWLPVTRGDIPNQGSTGSTFFIGAWQLDGGTGDATTFLGNYVIKLGHSITAPSRYYHDFRDFSNNYTQFILDIPGVGSINLDAKDVYKGLAVQYEIDLKTGDAKHIITADNKHITTIRCNYKTPVSYATFNNNFIGGANQIISGITSIGAGVGGAIGGDYGSAVKSGASGVGDLATGLVALESITSHQVSSQGTMGDILTNSSYTLTRHVYPCASQPIFNVGRKLNEYRTLSNLSGFCQCENAKLDTSAYGQIKDDIIAHMNNGFFIE